MITVSIAISLELIIALLWSQVIGGVQRFSAIRQLRQKGIRSITQRNCAVYGNGLSRLATLILARRHNEINQVQRVTTFPEIAASCRRLLFVHFATSGNHDPSYMPDVPWYNSKPYIDFKQECLQYLVSSRVVSACMHVLQYLLAIAYNHQNFIASSREEGCGWS